jgi:hypothetical protein
MAREEPAIKGGREVVEVRVVDGFEDVLKEPFGAGFFYNTPNSVYQLAFALSISQRPDAKDFLGTRELSASDIVKTLRDRQVLTDMKILDLGCGHAEFALVVKALGAKVYTSDVEDLDRKVKAKLERHIVINLNQSNAIEALQDATGSNFDLVTENIVGLTPMSRRRVNQPDPQRILQVGTPLLKRGGYLYEEGAVTDRVFRKK